MISVFVWTVVFSIATVISILLTGSRSLISGDITLMRVIQILLDWRFILGALLAFGARLSFIMVNNALLKIPDLAGSSTTITVLITSIATVFVVVANYFFLGERINISQGIGMFVILFGIFLVMR